MYNQKISHKKRALSTDKALFLCLKIVI